MSAWTITGGLAAVTLLAVIAWVVFVSLPGGRRPLTAPKAAETLAELRGQLSQAHTVWSWLFNENERLQKELGAMSVAKERATQEAADARLEAAAALAEAEGTRRTLEHTLGMPDLLRTEVARMADRRYVH